MIGAVALATSAIGTAALGTGEAHATTPVIGKFCSYAEKSNLRHTASGTPTVCANVGNRYAWVRSGRVDPKVRVPGSHCTGGYPVARTPQGKAVLCADGRWVSQG